MSRPFGHAIFLSPHYDDVVLSCGATVGELVDSGTRPSIVTIFGGEITREAMSGFALWKHCRWGLEQAENVVDTRRRENRQAVRILGSKMRNLGFPDAIYRGDRYQADSQLFGQLMPNELKLVDPIVAEVWSLPERGEGTVFVPLGAGNHVDHQLAYLVGAQLMDMGCRVYAYEDCPYAIHTPSSLAWRVQQLGLSADAVISNPIGPTLGRRLDAIACYKSQLPVVFRFTNDFRQAVTNFALIAGQGVPAERFWNLNVVRPSTDSGRLWCRGA